MKAQELLFVYNANGNLASAVLDFAHKIFSPSTYACHLCALTHGHFRIKQEWKWFVEALPIKAAFLHKDEFEQHYSIRTVLPAVFVMSGDVVQEIITQPELDNCQTLADLKKLVVLKLQGYVQYHHSHL